MALCRAKRRDIDAASMIAVVLNMKVNRCTAVRCIKSVIRNVRYTGVALGTKIRSCNLHTVTMSSATATTAMFYNLGDESCRTKR